MLTVGERREQQRVGRNRFAEFKTAKPAQQRVERGQRGEPSVERPGGVPGDPRLKDANIERGLLLKLRFLLLCMVIMLFTIKTQENSRPMVMYVFTKANRSFILLW